jgi:hypothetical protein
VFLSVNFQQCVFNAFFCHVYVYAGVSYAFELLVLLWTLYNTNLAESHTRLNSETRESQFWDSGGTAKIVLLCVYMNQISPFFMHFCPFYVYAGVCYACEHFWYCYGHLTTQILPSLTRVSTSLTRVSPESQFWDSGGTAKTAKKYSVSKNYF